MRAFELARTLYAASSRRTFGDFLPGGVVSQTGIDKASPFSQEEKVHMKQILIHWFDLDADEWMRVHKDEARLAHFYRTVNNQLTRELKFKHWVDIIGFDAAKQSLRSLSPFDSNRRLKGKISALKKTYNSFLDGYEHGRSSTC